jgi:hypothetical protein
MTKATAAAIFLFCSANLPFAQDLVILKNGDEIRAKVLEITSTEIRYRKLDNPDGPTLAVPEAEVSMIKYQDGRKILFRNNTPTSPENRRRRVEGPVEPRPVRIGFYADPLGFLEFGPLLGTEITIRSRLIIDASLRFPSLGALTYVVNNDATDGLPYEVAGLGVAGGLKYFVPSRLGGFYVGGLLSFAWETHRYAQGEPSEWESDYAAVMTLATIGYKFRFRHGFYVNTGAIVGIQYPFEKQWHYANDGTIYQMDKSPGPAGMLDVSLGYEF